jgi:hypothetical protein
LPPISREITPISREITSISREAGVISREIRVISREIETTFCQIKQLSDKTAPFSRVPVHFPRTSEKSCQSSRVFIPEILIFSDFRVPIPEKKDFAF